MSREHKDQLARESQALEIAQELDLASLDAEYQRLQTPAPQE